MKLVWPLHQLEDLLPWLWWPTKRETDWTGRSPIFLAQFGTSIPNIPQVHSHSIYNQLYLITIYNLYIYIMVVMGSSLWFSSDHPHISACPSSPSLCAWIHQTASWPAEAAALVRRDQVRWRSQTVALGFLQPTASASHHPENLM